MNYRQSVSLALLILLAFTVVCWIAVSEHHPSTVPLAWSTGSGTVQAQSVQEVAPYKFADLPHGEIFKAVHEGCELFIVEGSQRVTGAPDSGYFYAIATGRGCR